MLASDIPVKFPIPFANNAGAGFITNPIPQASQIGITAGAASLHDGFPPVTFLPIGAGGTPPWGADFNGILFEATSWDRWFSAGGPIPYDGTFSSAVGGYMKGAIVASATTFGAWWLSTADGNTTNPDASGAGWVPYTPLNMYAVDTGSANTYVAALSPVLVNNVVGLPIRIKIANANTGASTLDPGPGAHAVVRRDGSALIGGELVTGRIATFVWNGTSYEWQGTAPAPSSAITPTATDTQSAVTPAQLNPGASLANPGYAKLSCGLILQWGTTSSITNGTAIPLPIAFPNAGLIPSATINGNSGSVVGATLTTTTITLNFNPSPASLHWFAIGH